MRVEVDGQRCEGHTLCVLNAPDLFGSDEEDGHAIVLLDCVPAGLERAARLAALNCPEQAIQIVETSE